MAWIESHTVLLRHRKLVSLAKDLRLKPVYTLGHLHSLWHAALEQADNGDLTSWTDDFIAESASYQGDAPQFVSLLQKHRWLDGKVIHDWLDYAGNYLRSCKYRRNPEKWQEIENLHKSLKTTYMTKSDLVSATLPNLTDLTDHTKPTKPDVFFPFSEIWERYPNKDGKKQAENHFKSSVKTENDWKNINKALDNYLKSEKVLKGFIKNGSTWFNNWLDWVDFVQPEKYDESFMSDLRVINALRKGRGENELSPSEFARRRAERITGKALCSTGSTVVREEKNLPSTGAPKDSVHLEADGAGDQFADDAGCEELETVQSDG